MRHRVTGLAAEAIFFALLSLPPLVLAFVGWVGYAGTFVGSCGVSDMTDQLLGYSATFLTPEVVDSVIAPTDNDVLAGGRFDLVSVGFVLAVWSGSRVLNVMLGTISIMYGQSGVRGIVRTRLMSLFLYALGLVGGAVLVPLLPMAGGGVPIEPELGSGTVLAHSARAGAGVCRDALPGRRAEVDGVGSRVARMNAAIPVVWPERGDQGIRASARRAGRSWATLLPQARRVAPVGRMVRDKATGAALGLDKSRFGDAAQNRLVSLRTRRTET